MSNNSVQKKIILVVEDEALSIKRIDNKLRHNGFEVVIAKCVNQASDYLENLPEIPDVIWIDYYLKNSDCLKFLKILKTNKEWERIIILLVAKPIFGKDKKFTIILFEKEKYYIKTMNNLEDISLLIRKVVI